MIRSMLRVSALAGVIAFVAGCTTCYKVADATTGRSYYTTQVKTLDGGATRLKDERTMTEVTIQNLQLEKITKEQYESALHSAPTMRGM